MQDFFIRAIETVHIEALKEFTKIIAIAVRNSMEDFHVENLSDAQMEKLNPLIRTGIINALVAIAGSDRYEICDKYLNNYTDMVPTYWEDPKPDEMLLTALNQAENNINITFNSAFLNKQLAIGNIFYNKKTGCIVIQASFDFKQITDDNHSHRNKISAQLRKEGYQYDNSLMGYRIPVVPFIKQ